MTISIFSSALFAQTEKVDPKVTEAFGKAKVDLWQSQNPDSIVYYNFLVNHGYTIENIPLEKADYFETMVPLFSFKPQFANEKSDFSPTGLQKLNILKYEFEINPWQINFYKLGDTGKIIIFHSAPNIAKMIKEGKTTLE